MFACQKILFVLAIFISFKAISQKGYTAFPKTDYQIILPDTSFKINYDSSRFFSEKTFAKITFEQADFIDSSHLGYKNLISSLLKELSRPGNTILLDKTIDENHRLFKTRVDFDITDMSPTEKGVSNISWIYVINENSSPQILFAEYRIKYDEMLSDLFLKSLSSFSRKPVN